MSSSNRIDGWKAIGAYFGRDRTTAIRWADARGLPVRRLPGGKRATVYALKNELDVWAQSQSRLPIDDASGADAPIAARDPAARPHFWKPLLILSAIALSVGLVSAVSILSPGVSEVANAAAQLPDDPEAARLYLQARDDWARRKPDSLARAIAALKNVTRIAPDFAPAYASLADAYLLSREFGALQDADAFGRAQTAAEKAMALDGGAAEPHRAIGFIHYWRDHDAKAASQAFKRAQTLSPHNAQTHFWYGNVLSDNGAHAAAFRELDAARLIEPGSVAIQTDLAWALWSAGRRDEAVRMLNGLIEANPNFAVIHDCLSVIYLADGNYAAHAQAMSEFARLRDDASLKDYADDVKAALSRGLPVVQAVMMARARSDLERNPRQDHVWIAFLASLARDKPGLVSILAEAKRRNERWGSSGITSRIASHWRNDPDIGHLLDDVREKPIA